MDWSGCAGGAVGAAVGWERRGGRGPCSWISGVQGQREAKEEWVDMRDLEQGCRREQRRGEGPEWGIRGTKGWAQGTAWVGCGRRQAPCLGDRWLRAQEMGLALGESSAGSQAMGSPTWLCVQRGSGSSGRGDRDGELAAAICRERVSGGGASRPPELPGLQTPSEAAPMGPLVLDTDQGSSQKGPSS